MRIPDAKEGTVARRVDELEIIITCVQEVEQLERCLSSIERYLPQQRVIVVQMADWQVDPAAGKALHVRCIRLPKTAASAARNAGLAASTARYVWCMDSDNWLQGDPHVWREQLAAAIQHSPDAVFLQRAEEGRQYAPVNDVNRYNFTRHTIEWSVVWSRKYLCALGGYDVQVGVGSALLAQTGEGFSLMYRHFSRRGTSIYLPELAVGHPSLFTPYVDPVRQFGYIYGSTYTSMRELRRSPSLLALFWFVRTLIGIGRDTVRCAAARFDRKHRTLLAARCLGGWDAFVSPEKPRRKFRVR